MGAIALLSPTEVPADVTQITLRLGEVTLEIADAMQSRSPARVARGARARVAAVILLSRAVRVYVLPRSR